MVKALLSLFAAAALVSVSAQVNTPIETAPLVTLEDLIFDFLLGSGVQAGEVLYTGSEPQLASFTNAGEILGMESGLVMSSGVVLPSLAGPGFISGVAGNDDLLAVAQLVPQLIGEPFTVNAVYDVAILEFDFIPLGDSLSFTFAFASFEYNMFINTQFNDVFAFFLAGPGIEGPYSAPANFPDGSINIAVVPGSDPPLPITVSSVNNQLNSEFFVDNTAIPAPHEIPYKGFTLPLVAHATGLIPGETYHIRLGIADGSDTALDSAIFLEAGSFTSEVTAPDSGLGDLNGDGVLNILDLLVFLENLGCQGPDCTGDINSDGVVDVQDLLLWLSMFD